MSKVEPVVIAERILRFVPPGKKRGSKVIVKIYAPQPIENGNWSVLVQIHGPGKRLHERTIFGFDSVQALMYAMALVPLDTEALAHELGGKVTFLGREDLRFTYELKRKASATCGGCCTEHLVHCDEGRQFDFELCKDIP